MTEDTAQEIDIKVLQYSLSIVIHELDILVGECIGNKTIDKKY